MNFRRLYILEQCEALEKDLLKMPHCVNVDFDFMNFVGDLNEITFVIKHSIFARSENYLDVREKFKRNVLRVAAKYGLSPISNKGFVDYGQDYLFVVEFNKDNKQRSVLYD